ncbi:MAG TPA: hypothetical protein VLJ15_05330 [Gammaproteobacteria bacterium]|nr:hypothetical protein [Gammaproteobacteria bacterium]
MPSSHTESTTRDSQSEMKEPAIKHKVIILADYKNCFDILFDEITTGLQNVPVCLKIASALKTDLNRYLDAITYNADVVFYSLDGAEEKGNSPVNFLTLCKQRGWLYRHLEGNPFEGDIDVRHLVQGVFEDITENHPDDHEKEIFCFSGLVNDVLFPLRRHFVLNANDQIPLNATFNLVKFNWAEKLKDGVIPEDTIVHELGYVRRAQRPIVSVLANPPVPSPVSVPVKQSTAWRFFTCCVADSLEDMVRIEGPAMKRQGQGR